MRIYAPFRNGSQAGPTVPEGCRAEALSAVQEAFTPSAGGEDGSRQLTGANLARFWELRGRRVVESYGVLWGHHKGLFFSPLSPHLRIDAEQWEIDGLLRKAGIRGLRFPSSNLPGLPHGIFVIRPEGYTIHSVSQKQRGHVTRGLDNCDIRTLDEEELRSEGMELNLDTLGRQSRKDDEFCAPAKWKRLVKAIGATPGMTVHGAFVKGKLATYVVSCRDGEWLHLLYKMSRAADRNHYPDHALDFSIIQKAAFAPEIRFISNGSLPLLPNEGLGRYKRALGYELVEQQLCIHLHPLLASVLSNRVTRPMAIGARDLLLKSGRYAYWAKILEGALLSRPPR